MKTIVKEYGKDITVLNLTDTQLSDQEWTEGHGHRKILEYTVRELVKKLQPDLITVSGDLAWAGHDYSYDMLADFLDGFGIPWAPVFGNHDNQDGADAVNFVASRFLTHRNCMFEKGPEELGAGNYVISIEENGVPVSALFMLDSHDRMPYTEEGGSESLCWAKLIPQQLNWVEQQAENLKKRGCNDASIIMHIPNYAYRLASDAAYKNEINKNELKLEESYGEKCWNDGYTDSIGVQYEGIGSYPADDGVLESVKRTEIIKRIISGHDHINNWMIHYEGIDMIYALKTGAGCYWNTDINGGTVLKINKDGVYKVFHEYIDVSHLL